MLFCVNLPGLLSPSSLSYPSLDPRTSISIITPTAGVSASIGINRRYLIVVTLSRSEGSVVLGREMLSAGVTLSRSEGSVALGSEMLRGVYPERSEWAQYDMKRLNQKTIPSRRRTNMFIIPDDFACFMLKLFGEEGRAWLDRLPTILTSCEERWNLTIGAPVANLSFHYVAPAVLADGTEVIVKTGLTDEFPSQPRALQHFDGHGMVQLLAYDEHNAAMLLERLKPGTSLRAVDDDEIAIEAAADVMRKIWRPLPQKHDPFPTVCDWGKGFARLRKLYDGGTGPIPSAMFDKAEKLYAELSASMAEPVLLHGDLHQDNILSAEREPWLAIDPKGVIGEPVFETGALLRNFWPDILSPPDPRKLMARRIDQLSTALGFDRTRIYDWGFSQAVLSVIWTVEDTGKLEHEGLYFVELLDAIEV